MRQAQELDPLTHRADLAAALLRGGWHDEALQAALTCVEFDPEYGRGRSTLGWAYIKNGMPDRGIAELEQAVRLVPGNTMYLGQLGEAYGLTGRVDEARAVLARLQQMSGHRYVAPYHMAYVYTGLGEHEAAIEYLERAYEERAGSVYAVKGSFLFTPLRVHSRFQALLAKLNLA